MDKLYTNYVNAEKDDEYPTEIVYWEDAMKEIERLRMALKKYGHHYIGAKPDDICKCLIHSKYSCTCGFREALKEE